MGGYILSLARIYEKYTGTPADFITREFVPDMSAATVASLSQEWHEAVAANMQGGDRKFPEPWFSAGKIGDLDVVPITSAADLYLEGKLLHHCVGTYAAAVELGDRYCFGIRAGEKRFATVAFAKKNGRAEIEQVRGPCNAPVPAIEKVVRAWLRKQPRPKWPEPPAKRNLFLEIVDDDIPF